MANTHPQVHRLRRSDLFILPLISLLTIFFLCAAAEIGARTIWPEQKEDSCLLPGQTTPGHRFKSSCISYTKAAEGPWVENDYNDCGWRSPGSCHAPVPSGGRIAVLGSSVAMGYLIPYRDSWAARSVVALEKRCGKPVDIQNMAAFYSLNDSAQLVPKAIELHSSAAIFVVVPFDLYALLLSGQQSNRNDPDADAAGFGFAHQLAILRQNSRAVEIAESYMFKDRSLYLRLYLHNGDKADFLRAPFSAPWKRRLELFDHLLGQMSDAFHRAGIPLILVFSPQQAQAMLMSAPQNQPAIDPTFLSRAIGDIARKHGVIYGDASTAYTHIPNAEDFFYSADGHLSAGGSFILSDTVVSTLAVGRAPILHECSAFRRAE